MKQYALKKGEHFICFDPVCDEYCSTNSVENFNIWDFHHDPEFLEAERLSFECVELNKKELEALEKKFGGLD